MGAVPRFADVDPETQLMTAATMEPAMTPAVRCVIAVHLHGRTVEMDRIMELADIHPPVVPPGPSRDELLRMLA